MAKQRVVEGRVMREKGGKAEGGRNKGREEGDEWGRVMSGGG